MPEFEEAELIPGVPDNEEMWEKQRAADFLSVSLYVLEGIIRRGDIKVYRYTRTTHRVRAAEVREFRDRSAHAAK